MTDKSETTVEIVRQRLADGRTIADSDVHKLVVEIDRLRGLLKGFRDHYGNPAWHDKVFAEIGPSL